MPALLYFQYPLCYNVAWISLKNACIRQKRPSVSPQSGRQRGLQMAEKAFFSFRRGDLIAIALVLLLALAVFAAYLPSGGGGGASTLLILQDGALIQELPLHSDAQLELGGAYTNTVVIRDGRAAIAHSDCPGGDCMRSGWISEPGRSIVCLPNRVELRIRGEAAVDFVLR